MQVINYSTGWSFQIKFELENEATIFPNDSREIAKAGLCARVNPDRIIVALNTAQKDNLPIKQSGGRDILDRSRQLRIFLPKRMYVHLHPYMHRE